jgi:glutathione S-transferase
MIRVHHLNNSRSQRVLWMLEELQLPYEVVRYERDAKTMLAPATLRAVHPLGKSPVLEDGELKLAESGAIIEYLAERYGPELAVPPGAPGRARYLHWLHYAEGSAMPPLFLKLVLSRMGLLGRPARPYADRQIALHLDYLEGELGEGPWFMGERFTAADIQLSFPLEAAASRGGLNARRSGLWDFLERIHARPAYCAALERGRALHAVGLGEASDAFPRLRKGVRAGSGAVDRA